MKLSGVYRFNIPREQLWEALFDPAVVGECVPGLKNFTQQTADRYDVELGMRVGIVSGTYKGTVETVEKTAPASCRVVIQGTGVRTNLKGEGSVVLTAENGGTTLTFEGDVRCIEACCNSDHDGSTQHDGDSSEAHPLTPQGGSRLDSVTPPRATAPLSRAQSRIGRTQTMAHVPAFHSVNSPVHHVCSNCTEGNNIELRCKVAGTGSKPLCQTCADRINNGTC